MSSKYGPLYRGVPREDGRIFWCYVGGREWWVTKKKFASLTVGQKLQGESPKALAYKRAYSATIDPRRKLFHRTKHRAKKSGTPFELKLSDISIPSVCPVLGIPLVVGDCAGSPSLDRIRPELGYVKGNVAVISNRANMIKNNATSRELFLVAEWARSMGI